MFEYDNQATSGPADTQLFVSQDQVDEAYITLLHKVQSLAPKVTIKTLPFFNRLFYFEKTCNLVGFNQPIAGMRGAPSRIAPYTGSYKVIGFSHVITTEEAYSTFSLMRTGFQQPEQQISRTLKDVLIGEIDDRIAEKEEALKSKLIPPRLTGAFAGQDTGSPRALLEVKLARLKEQRERLQGGP